MKYSHLSFSFLLLSMTVHAESSLFEKYETELEFAKDQKGLQTISIDLNRDRYPDFIFTDAFGNSGTEVKAFINESGKKLRKIPIIGLQLYPFAEMKLIRGLLKDHQLTAIVRYLESGKNPKREMEFYKVTLGNSLLFQRVISPVYNFIDNTGDFTVMDFNRDGLNDLLVVNHYANDPKQSEYAANPPKLFMSSPETVFSFGQYKFTDVSVLSGVSPFPKPDLRTHEAPIPSYSVSACDVNSDGYIDFLIGAYGRRWNKLFLHTTPLGFKNFAEEWRFDSDENGHNDFRGNGNSFVSACADADNDGLMDVFQGEITHKWAGPTSDLSAMLWNENNQYFTRAPMQPRPTSFDNQGDMGAMWGDIDLDGLQDLVLANSDYPPETELDIFQNIGMRSFKRATPSWLPDTFINPKGSLLVDFDLDGDLDLVSSSSPFRWTKNPTPFIRIYKNKTIENDSDRAWLEVKLTGNNKQVAEMPFGARVTVYRGDEQYIREYTLGYGSSLQYPEMLHFGFGKKSSEPIIMDIRWPNGKTKRYNVRENKIYTINYEL